MGPLHGLTVIELGGLGPCPMAGMLLADMGARVVRIERANDPTAPSNFVDISMRGKLSVTLNLRDQRGVDVALKLIDTADALIEGYRPGVAERLGLGPAQCRSRNEKLVYGRVTGWGQSGPLAMAASHDINYIATTGVLHAIGPGDRKPSIPLNLVGDMGGGGMLLAFGVVCALLEARTSGIGQVVDAAMVDGSALMLWTQYGMLAGGTWNCERRESNILDGGAFFYDTYETADGKYVAIGAVEQRFFDTLLDLMGLDRNRFADRWNRDRWPAMREELALKFKSRTRAEWCELLEQSDACFSPVLSMRDAPMHSQLRARDTYVDMDGVMQPAPAPRFSRTEPALRAPPRTPGADGVAILRDAGYSEAEIESLRVAKVLYPV